VKRNKLIDSESFPLGTARLQQVYLRTSPPSLLGIKHLKENISQSLESWTRRKRTATIAYASSGTARALAKLISPKKEIKEFQLKDLKKVIRKLSFLNATDLLHYPGMESKRIDMILSGGLLLEEICNQLEIKKIRLTQYSLRDGILEEQLKFKKHTPWLSWIENRVQHFQPESKHPQHVRELSKFLFSKLKPLHRLPILYLQYLEAAALLHDVGEYISPVRHAEHSAYIVRAIDIPSLSIEEVEFIAGLCLFHRQDAKRPKSTIQGKEFLYLLALLQISDALDRGHREKISIQKVQIFKKEIRITLKTLDHHPPELEILRVDQKKKLFESVFGRRLVVAPNLRKN
jgi:exopolyphosphatase/guanosine-5'-triphosphate,3'-diphosphate pyrophosphatase